MEELIFINNKNLTYEKYIIKRLLLLFFKYQFLSGGMNE